jgi:hypothetical protein
MVPDLPSPSRRGLIAGAGLALAGVTVGVGATEPTILPDPLTDQASRWLPDPTDHRWHPPVSEAHARDAVGRLVAEVERDREYDARGVAPMHAGNRRAELRLSTARHYRDQLRDRVDDGDGEPWTERIDRLDARFRAAIDEFPDRAVDALAMEPGGPRAFDSGRVVSEKRAAMKRCLRVVGDSPAPLLSILTERAGEDIDVAEVGFAGSYERPIWRDRVDAYCYALIARMKLTEYPRVYERFVE